MPELPEVEHVVRALRRAVLRSANNRRRGKSSAHAGGISPASFKRKLRGPRIDAINRRGKYILIELDNRDVLLVHLRMTGKFVCLRQDQPLPPYPHVVFYLDDDRRLVFCDMRQFGRMRLVAGAKLVLRFRKSKRWRPEPLHR